MAASISAGAEARKHGPAGDNRGGSEEIVKLLKEFNLTRLESEIYIGLLRTRESMAKDISQQLGINRVDVYRVLKKLAARGLVIVTLTEPTLFDSVHPRVAFLALVGEIERRARRMKEIAPDVALELETIERQPRIPKNSSSTDAFRLLRGDPSVSEAKQIVARAEHSIQGIWSIKRALRIDAIDVLLESIDRGVKVQIVVELTKGCLGIPEVDELVRRAYIRHCDGIDHSLRFTIADGREAMLGAANIDSGAMDDMSLWSGRKEMVQLLSAQFQILWNKSEDGRARMKFLADSPRDK